LLYFKGGAINAFPWMIVSKKDFANAIKETVIAIAKDKDRLKNEEAKNNKNMKKEIA